MSLGFRQQCSHGHWSALLSQWRYAINISLGGMREKQQGDKTFNLEAKYNKDANLYYNISAVEMDKYLRQL